MSESSKGMRVMSKFSFGSTQTQKKWLVCTVSHVNAIPYATFRLQKEGVERMGLVPSTTKREEAIRGSAASARSHSTNDQQVPCK